MPLVMTSPPQAEPVTVADAKAHMRIDGTDEDILIASLLLTSRLHIETALSLALITQSWTLRLDRWPQTRHVELPMTPLQSVDAVRVKDAIGGFHLIAPAGYLVDIASRPARLIWNGIVPPEPGIAADGIEIDVTAGFGPDALSVPAPLKHAILMLTAHWYEHRNPGEIGANGARVPEAVSSLINPFRTIRL
jgi:uncharacterized phiE125 gp8 family phage protein